MIIDSKPNIGNAKKSVRNRHPDIFVYEILDFRLFGDNSIL